MARAWLRFHAALRKTWKQERSPCVSTGRSIHAVPRITPPPNEGIEDPPSRPKALAVGVCPVLVAHAAERQVAAIASKAAWLMAMRIMCRL